MEVNPYQPPAAETLVTAVIPDQPAYPASTGQRFITFAVDYVLSQVMGVLTVAVPIITIWDEATLDAIPDVLLGVLTMSIYYALFETLWKRTPGKWLAGTRVVSSDDGDVTFARIVLRTLSRFVPFEAFSAFGGGPMLHDNWSKTRVVTHRAPKYLSG